MTNSLFNIEARAFVVETPASRYMCVILDKLRLYIGLDRSSARKRQTYAITYALECKALNLIRGLEGSDLTWKI